MNYAVEHIREIVTHKHFPVDAEFLMVYKNVDIYRWKNNYRENM